MKLHEIEEPDETPPPPESEETAKQRILRMRFKKTESPRIEWAKKNLEWNEHAEMYVVRLASFSDYSGSMVERANSAFLLKTFPKLVGVESGNAGTVWTGVKEENLRFASKHTFEDFKEVIESLEDYCSLDDDLLSQMEMEAYNDYWNEEGRVELRTALYDRMPTVESELAVALLSKEDLFQIFRDNDNGGIMEIETGGGVYFRADALADKISPDEVIGRVGDIEAIAQGMKEKVWNSGLNNKFFDTIVRMYGRVQPDLAKAVTQLDDIQGFRLMTRLAKIADTDWKVDYTPRSEEVPPELYIGDQDLIDMAAVLRPEYLFHLRPESPGQQRFKFAESVVTRMI